MKIRILYNQEMAGGGATPSPAPSSSPAPAAAAPAASSAGGSTPSTAATPYERFQEQLTGLRLDADKPSQPASDGKQTDGQASPAEGDASGENTDDQGTTGQPDGDSTDGEAKGAANGWSEDELKTLKAHGLDDMPFHPSAKKLLDSSRELRAQADRVSASNANAITEAETLRQAVYAAAHGDPKMLQDIIGNEVNLKSTGPDEVLNEIKGYHSAQRDILQGIITDLEGRGQMDAAQALLDAGNRVLSFWDKKAQVVMREKERAEDRTRLMKEFGKTSDPGEAYKALSGKAKENLAAITAEDAEAAKYYTEIEEATKDGGPLRAMGITLARAFGSNLHTAKYFIQVGKALHVLKNQPQILNDSRKKWEADYERKKALGGPRGSTTGGSSGGKTATDAAISNLAGSMRAFMGR